MRILLIHNRYTQSGGEDAVFDNEEHLLKENGINVKTVIFENKETRTVADRIKLFAKSIFSLSSFYSIKEVINTFKPDIIHIHNLFYNASPSIVWAAKLKKIPVVITSHNFRLICQSALLLRSGNVCEKCRNKIIPYWGLIYRCFRNSLSESFVLTTILTIHKLIGTWRKGVSAFIVLTPFAAEIIEKSSLKISKQKIYIKPNWTFAISTSCFERKNYFLYVGRLSVEKGILFLIDMFKENGMLLHIIGDGPLVEEIRNVKEQNIVWLGSQPREQVLKNMAESKALVFSSRCYENFPMVIIEAFATGTPVIAPSLGSIPYIIEHGKTGLLFTPNSKMDFMRQLDLLNSDNGLYRQIQELSIKEYFEKYTPEKAFKSLISIYQKIIKTKKNNGRA
jgi:glycosyltransferase involved in cell wall biosynthesis